MIAKYIVISNIISAISDKEDVLHIYIYIYIYMYVFMYSGTPLDIKKNYSSSPYFISIEQRTRPLLSLLV